MAIGLGTAILGGAAISGIGSLISGIFGAGASKSAAQAQEQAANNALMMQEANFQQTQQETAPFRAMGTAAAGQLGQVNQQEQAQLPSLTSVINPSVSTLQNLPGYQFQLNQGLQATQNQYASQGLGASGAAMKGATGYAEGLAQSSWATYLQQMLGQNANISNIYTQAQGQLANQAQIGANAALGTGALGKQAATGAGNAAMAGGAASAAGTVGSANALVSGLSGATSAAGTSLLSGPLGNMLGAQQGLGDISSQSAGLYGAQNGLTAADYGPGLFPGG